MVFLNILLFVFCFSAYSSETQISNISIDSKDLIQTYQSDSEITKWIRSLPIQDRGRIKPFDTFARESVQHISGKSHSSSVHLIMTWLLIPQHWDQEPFIWIRKAQVKQALKLNEKQSHFSPSELMSNQNFQRELDELNSRKKQKIKLDNYFRAIEKLESRLALYQAIKAGYLPLWFPDSSQNDERWLSVVELKKDRQLAFIQLLTSYSQSVLQSNKKEFKKVINNFKNLTKNYVNTGKIKAEIHYNSFQPFRWSWVLYLVSLMGFFAFILWPTYQKYVFFIPLGGAFLLHTYGIILRCYIMSRPPVSNMFETLLWVPWSALVFSLILALIKKTKFPLVIGSVCAFLCLFLSDTASILDGRMEPLEAVLRSNFWLSTHVLIITMSYAAFFLAFILSDFVVFQFLLGNKKPEKIYFWFLNRLLQVGVLLLALGTILGAVWADYSWGRFWGWDPKEVWALVSLLGYLALFHARLQGWIKEFGLAIGSICCFFLIIMAWYGVNFVLGKGLHSYGFGQGGFVYVLSFVILHLLFLWIAWKRKKL